MLLQAFPSWKQALFLMPELQLTLFACFVLIADVLLPRGKKTFTAYISLIGLAFTALGLAQVYYITRNALPTFIFYDMYVIDYFAFVFKAIILVATAISIAISIKYLDQESSQHGDYYSLMLFAATGMMFMASGYNLLIIYVALELMAISVYVLVGYLKHNDKSNEGALKYFLLGAFSSGIFLYGVSLIYATTGESNLSKIAFKISFLVLSEEVKFGPGAYYLLALAVILVAVGLMFKIAAVPFHMWAPDAYEGAPTPITAFMSVGVKVASYAILARIFLIAFPALRTIKEIPGWTALLIIVAALTMTIGNVGAMTQNNVKRMFAYSSIAQAGYILLGVISGNETGYTGLIFYLLAYMAMNLGVFAIIIVLKRDKIAGDRVEHFNGLVKKNSGLAVIMLFLLIGLAGIPPTSGFIGKYLLFAGLIRANNDWYSFLAVLAVINTVISFYYYARIIKAMFIENPTDDKAIEVNIHTKIVLGLTTALTLFIGVYPQPFIEVSRLATRNLAPTLIKEGSPTDSPATPALPENNNPSELPDLLPK